MAYAQSDEYANLGWEVIREHHDLEWIANTDISIGFLHSPREKKTRGRLCYGECVLVQDIYKPYCPHDFLIILYDPNICQMSREQLKILLYHELLHVGVDEKNGQMKYRVVPHDVEDFRRIIDRYGIDWAVTR